MKCSWNSQQTLSKLSANSQQILSKTLSKLLANFQTLSKLPVNSQQTLSKVTSVNPLEENMNNLVFKRKREL